MTTETRQWSKEKSTTSTEDEITFVVPPRQVLRIYQLGIDCADTTNEVSLFSEGLMMRTEYTVFNVVPAMYAVILYYYSFTISFEFDWKKTKKNSLFSLKIHQTSNDYNFLRIDIFWMVSYWERRLKCKKPIFKFDATALEYFKFLQQNINTEMNFKLLKLQITLNSCLKKNRSFQKEGKFRSFSSLHVKSKRCESQQFEPIGGKQWRLEPKPFCKVQKNLWGFAYTKRPLQIQRQFQKAKSLFNQVIGNLLEFL